MATKKLQVIGGFGPEINDSAINTDSVWSSKNTVDKLCPAFTKSGNVVTCSPVEGYPLGVVTRFEPVQSGSGDPSPENIRPISGHTQVKVWHMGTNLIPNQYVQGEAFGANSSNQIVITTVTGSCRIMDIPLQPGTYTLSGSATAYMAVYDTDKNRNQTLSRLGGVALPYTFTVPDDGIDYLFGLHCEIAYENMFQLEYGAIDTTYEPYRGEELTLDLGQTVYGGSLDWNTGVLTIDRGIYDLGEFSWEVCDMNEEEDGWAIIRTKDLVGVAHDWTDSQYPDYSCVCSHYRTVPSFQVAEISNDYIIGYSEYDPETGLSAGLYLENDDFIGMTIEEITEALSGVQLSIQLKNPITIQLTPHEMLALSGVNTLFSDCGTTTVTGRKDLGKVIEELIFAIENIGYYE